MTLRFKLKTIKIRIFAKRFYEFAVTKIQYINTNESSRYYKTIKNIKYQLMKSPLENFGK